MEKSQKKSIFLAIIIFGILSTVCCYAETVIPSDYMIAGETDDTWTYVNIDGSHFTQIISVVNSGLNAGSFFRGNSNSGIVYDLTNSVLTIYEWDKTPLDPPLVFSEIEFGQIVTLNYDPDDPSIYLFCKIPIITVQAGTFNDVIAIVWIDDDFPANSANTQLGLDPLITYGVTDIDYFARGIGNVKHQGIEAANGLSDGDGYELVNTTVVNKSCVWDIDNDSKISMPDVIYSLQVISGMKFDQ